jgi:hypothetical protein
MLPPGIEFTIGEYDKPMLTAMIERNREELSWLCGI